jgi:hypothetical protein
MPSRRSVHREQGVPSTALISARGQSAAGTGGHTDVARNRPLQTPCFSAAGRARPEATPIREADLELAHPFHEEFGDREVVEIEQGREDPLPTGARVVRGWALFGSVGERALQPDGDVEVAAEPHLKREVQRIDVDPARNVAPEREAPALGRLVLASEEVSRVGAFRLVGHEPTRPSCSR